MTDVTRSDANARSYLIGYAVSVVLTAIPFAMVYVGGLSRPWLDAIIGVSAVIQILVHLRLFLHIDLTHTPRENLLALGFALVIVCFMAGGTLWIMTNLSYRMMGMGS